MKPKSFITFTFLAFFLINCGNNNAPTNEKKVASNSSIEQKEESATSPSSQGNDIIGEWELVGSVVDKNDNGQIDEGERKDLAMVAYKDYMKLKSDGTGLFTIAKMEGRYEAIAKESGGKRFLTWFDNGGKHRIGTIISVTKTELHIKEPGGSGLFIWKRL